MLHMKKLALALCAGLMALCLCACGSSSSSKSSTETYDGTTFTLGNLVVTAYDQEIVIDTGGNDCLAIYLHVINKGTTPESVMGTYNVSRNQGSTGTLKVGVAYGTNGNPIHTAEKRIAAGTSADVCMCFKLVNKAPVSVTFGNAKLGVAETNLSFKVTE